jgi:hypothetical protein
LRSGVITTAGDMVVVCLLRASRRAAQPAPLTDALYRTAVPRAQELKLREVFCAALVPQVLAQPSMPRLRSLEVYADTDDDLGAESFAPLWAAPWFSQLQELSVTTDQGFGDPGLAPLRAAPLLRKLAVKKLYGGRTLTAADGRALAAAALPELRELQLYKIEPGFVEALAAAPWLAQLESLQVTGGYARPDDSLAATDGRSLATATLVSLTRLVLNGMEPDFMAACAAAAWLTRLVCLTLRGEGGLLGGGGGGGGGGLPGSPAWVAAPFTALASLTLSYDATAPPSEVSRFVALVAAPWFGRLQS